MVILICMPDGEDYIWSKLADYVFTLAIQQEFDDVWPTSVSIKNIFLKCSVYMHIFLADNKLPLRMIRLVFV